MTKVTPQGLTALHATLSGHSVSLKHAIGAVSALLMLVCSASAGAADAPATPKHRVTLTDGQRAAPVIEQRAPTPGADIPSTATSVSTVAVVVSGKTFPVGSHFPQSGFVGATFQMLANGHDTQANAQYQWRSDQSWVTVDKAGTVTFTDMPTPTTRTVTLTATPMAGGAPLTTSLSVNRWFINAKAEKMTGPAAVAWCKAKGKGFAVPDAAVMTATTDGTPSLRTANGALWNEWGPMALYRSGWQLDNYWAAKTQGPAREMVGLVGGSFYRVPDSSLYNVTCVRSTQ